VAKEKRIKASAIGKSTATASLADVKPNIHNRPGSQYADAIELSDSEDDKGLVESEVAREKRIKLLEVGHSFAAAETC
jgi:hypothetical protein